MVEPQPQTLFSESVHEPEGMGARCARCNAPWEQNDALTLFAFALFVSLCAPQFQLELSHFSCAMARCAPQFQLELPPFSYAMASVFRLGIVAFVGVAGRKVSPATSGIANRISDPSAIRMAIDVFSSG